MIITELVSNIFIKKTQSYVWPPNLRIEIKPDNYVIKGISGISKVSTDKYGVRGGEINNNNKIKILCVGGSTTECMYLDDSETWPRLLQSRLKKNYQNISICNIGRSGNGTNEHIVQVEYMLSKYENIKYVILLAGINDFSNFLFDKNFDKPDPNDVMRKAFTISPISYSESNLYKNTNIWFLARNSYFKIKSYFGNPIIQDIEGQYLTDLRAKRFVAKKIRKIELPALEVGVSNFIRNVEDILGICYFHNAELIILTQPFSWDLQSEYFKNFYWFGWTNRTDYDENSYFSLNALSHGLKFYNNALITHFRKNLTVINTASPISKKMENFYDDCHFTEQGAIEIANLIYAELFNMLSKYKYTLNL